MKYYFTRAARHRAENALHRQRGLLENRMSTMKAMMTIIDAMNHFIPWIEREPLDMERIKDLLYQIKKARGPAPELIYASPS